MKDLSVARALVEESRAARLGLGHWANVSHAVRIGNARTALLLAASYRRGDYR